MAEREFPAPVSNPESDYFFAAADEDRFMIRRCSACDKAHWYPRALCPFCFGGTVWEEASGKGVIYSYSVMRRVPAPYAIAYVALAEGPVMMTNLVDCDFDALRIGQAVTLVFKPGKGGGSPVPCFRPE